MIIFHMHSNGISRRCSAGTKIERQTFYNASTNGPNNQQMNFERCNDDGKIIKNKNGLQLQLQHKSIFNVSLYEEITVLMTPLTSYSRLYVYRNANTCHLIRDEYALAIWLLFETQLWTGNASSYAIAFQMVFTYEQ